jgi:hypothetical protein
VESLPPGTGFTIRVFAYNAKGSSDRVELRGFTLGVDTQKHIRFLHLSTINIFFIFYSIFEEFPTNYIIIKILLLLDYFEFNRKEMQNKKQKICIVPVL